MFANHNPYGLEGINLTIAINAVSILTLIFNYLINKTILFTCKMGRPDLQGEKDFNLIWKTTLAQFLNQAILIFAIKYKDIKEGGSKSLIYGPTGLISSSYLNIVNTLYMVIILGIHSMKI